MNYEEIAVAYDAQADAVLAVAPMPNSNWELVATVLELRTKAEDCRNAARVEARNIAAEEFHQRERLNWMAIEERQADSAAKQAAALEAIAKKVTTEMGFPP